MQLLEECDVVTKQVFYQEYMPAFIRIEDIGWIALMWLFALVIRAVMVAVLFKPLQWSSKYGASWQDATFMVWGGLRGAVGLALAMTYYQAVTEMELEGGDDPNDDRKRVVDAVRVLMLVGFIALLTLVVQAPLSATVMRCLGIIKGVWRECLVIQVIVLGY